MPKRKKKPEEPENVERWMLTYLDMITLLMAFFCILFAFAQVDAVKFKQVAQSMNIAMGSGGGGSNALTNYSGTGFSDNSALMRLRENSEYQAMIKLIREYMAKQGLNDKISTKITDRGLIVGLKDQVLFASGSAELSDQAREVLDKMASILLAGKSDIKVEGHTDNVPIHTARYESNWQLSTDRATNVIMYWIGKYPDKQPNLSAGGYGEYHPVDSNDTPEGRANNRRVEFVVLRSSSSER
ncbi:MAG TPA: flagellar motor protein MotB [Bacillota bacterium]|nr:flagellar motor protein MotB [Bacillota bacterium]